ncbi:MAG TPA: sulfotransferase family 2 domain-containing protein [bacterium]|nr:sulfotransferase family 2 domain-containing protein [bacterium]
MIFFLHIPKTAGTTFQFILENTFGIGHCHLGHLGNKVADQRDFDFARNCFPWMRSIAGHNLCDPTRFAARDPFYVSFLREPVARVFSQYQDERSRCKRAQSFEDMLQTDPNFKNIQVKRLAGGQPDLGRAKLVLEKFHFAGLTEKFDLSLHMLQKICPVKLNYNYKRKVTARDNTLKQSLEKDARAVDMTREANQLDLALYDFAVKEIFPKFLAQTGFSAADKVASFDKYESELQPNFLLHRLYNQTFFRQVCKLYKKRRAREVAA